MHGASHAEFKKTDAEAPDLSAEKARIRADYEVQLKAAEDQVERLNTELIKIRADLAAAQAKLANIVVTTNVPPPLEQPVKKPLSVSVPPKGTPVKSGLGGPRPSAPVKKGIAVPPPPGGGLMYNDGQGRSYRIVNGQRVYY